MMRRVLREELLKYNDYELLYLIGEQSEEAMNIMIEKYQFLVKKMINKFNIPPKEKEDFLQEGIMMIYKATKTYNLKTRLSFTRYVEMLIYHRFIDLIRQKKKQVDLIDEDTIDYLISKNEPSYLEETICIDYEQFSDLEKEIFKMQFLECKTSREISKILNLEINRVYATSDRIRKKVRKMNPKK